MGFIDNFTSDTPVTIKHDEYYALMREATKAELLMNAVKAGVPSWYVDAMATGELKEPVFESKDLEGCEEIFFVAARNGLLYVGPLGSSNKRRVQ